MLTIFAGTNAYLDDLPLEKCRPFEGELYRFVENAHPHILQQIREKKIIDDALRAELHSLLKEFKERFVSEHVAASAQ